MQELKLRYDDTSTSFEIGCDEVGRGCCAGPVVAAAVILDSSFIYPKLRDSKKMTEKARDTAFDYLTEKGNGVLRYSIGVVSSKVIDQINILQASMKAMHLAIDGLSIESGIDRFNPGPDNLILVDGNYFLPYRDSNHECIIKGDDKYLSIAAASVIAKVYRDRLMTKLSLKFPVYSWSSNKGYGTVAHLQAISNHGYTDHHRMSYSLKLPNKTI